MKTLIHRDADLFSPPLEVAHTLFINVGNSEDEGSQSKDHTESRGNPLERMVMTSSAVHCTASSCACSCNFKSIETMWY